MSFSDLGQLFENSSALETPIEVPDLVNQNYEQWERRFTSGEYDLKLKVVSQAFSSSVAEGFVIDQTPLSGETVQPGSTISVTVSKGEATRQLPEFENASFAELQETLTKAGLCPSTTCPSWSRNTARTSQFW